VPVGTTFTLGEGRPKKGKERIIPCCKWKGKLGVFWEKPGP